MVRLTRLHGGIAGIVVATCISGCTRQSPPSQTSTQAPPAVSKSPAATPPPPVRFTRLPDFIALGLCRRRVYCRFTSDSDSHPKGEFETTAEYKSRVAASGDTVWHAFRLPDNGPYGCSASIEYDADKQRFQVTVQYRLIPEMSFAKVGAHNLHSQCFQGGAELLWDKCVWRQGVGFPVKDTVES